MVAVKEGGLQRLEYIFLSEGGVKRCPACEDTSYPLMGRIGQKIGGRRGGGIMP